MAGGSRAASPPRTADESSDAEKGPVVSSTTNRPAAPSLWKAWQYIFDWYPSHYSKEERRLLRKLDCFIMPLCCLMFFIKWLDQGNINNAYVSGMKEELHLNGNQYSLFGTFYNIGYLLFEIPSMMLISRPTLSRYYPPTMELLWGIVTFCQARLRNEHDIFGIRFLLGVLETPASSGSLYILTSWYRADEVFKRAGVWYVSSNAGSMFGGYLQAAAYNNLNGVLGMSGWRWLFIIDGIISVPIAIAGFFLFPGIPQSPRVWWLTERDQQLARARMGDDGVKESTKIGKRMLKRVFMHWHFYIAIATYVCFQCTSYVGGQMALWLKYETQEHGTYTIPQINTIPTGVQGVAIVTGILSTSLCMVYPIWTTFTAASAVLLFCNVVLLVWDIPVGLTMPALPGFTDNPFETRSDLVRATGALLSPLEQYKSPQKAFIKLSTDTAAGFDEVSAQLEGFARPLWAIASLLAPASSADSVGLDLNSWACGLRAGTNPASSEYWGDLGDFDQRMVEMESIAYALLMAPAAFLSGMDAVARENLETWLCQINGRQMPQNNWRWFRVLVNLALGSQEEDVVVQDLNLLDSFDLGEGWSSDGLWGDERKQADYYSGSFAIQFARMLYVRFMEDRGLASNDWSRIQKYKLEARQFASGFWRYFDVDGGAIPFGRSLTYRFAFAAFWSAVAIAGVQLDEPLNNIGVIKGLLLRHLRWWGRQTGIFNTDGTINIGYTYPNMFLSENYNSPQSVYWCLKSFTILCLPESHPFWIAKELPHPLAARMLLTQPLLDEVKLLWQPRHILCGGRSHHFLLSSGQGTTKSHRSREAKYGKMAYSSFFGFSVPSGALLEQMAPDSTLTVSLDDGEAWIVRANPFNVQGRQIPMCNSNTAAGMDTGATTVPALVSTWRPKKAIEFEVRTTLIPALELWSGWHFRIHKVRWSPAAIQPGPIRLVDAGFAASGVARTGLLYTENELRMLLDQDAAVVEAWGKDEQSCLILSNGSASGVVDLQTDVIGDGILSTRSPLLLRADANTNLIMQRTVIPAVQHTLVADVVSKSAAEMWLATGVFAVSKTSGLDVNEIRKLWLKRPKIQVAAKLGEEDEIRIMLH